jgi:predicted Fe-Mo cluster-binding NifX family protein
MLKNELLNVLGGVRPKALPVLKSADVAVDDAGEGTVKQALESLDRGELTSVTAD